MLQKESNNKPILSLKQFLISKGVPEENHFDNHYSDLYVKKTKQTTKLLEQLGIKNLVSLIFRNQTDNNELWYDIPFGYSEYFDEKVRQ